MVNASDSGLVESNFYKYNFLYLCNDISFVLCSLVLFALFKSREKWISKNAYLKLSCLIVFINLIKTLQLLVYRHLDKDGDSESCALQGVLLIATEILNQLCAVLLSIECFFMIRIDLSSNFLKYRGIKDNYCSLKNLVHKSVRYRNYCISMFVITCINCTLIGMYYGFGSSFKNPTYCNYKHEHGEALYHWITIFSPLAVFTLTSYMIYYLENLQRRLRVQKSKSLWALFRKLILLPGTFLVVNIPFMIHELFPSGKQMIPYTVLYAAGSSMPGLIAVCIWFQNSFVKKYIRNNIFCCFCAPDDSESVDTGGRTSSIKECNDTRVEEMDNAFREKLIQRDDDSELSDGPKRVATSLDSILPTDIHLEIEKDSDILDDDSVSL